MREDIENKMLIDGYWLDYDENNKDDDDEFFYLKADEEYDEWVLDGMHFNYSREENGYHF